MKKKSNVDKQKSIQRAKKKDSIGKREFIQHTSKYLKIAEESALYITHRGQTCLKLSPVKPKSIHDLSGICKKIKVFGDINEHVLPEFEKW